jgi:hypothetical protein
MLGRLLAVVASLGAAAGCYSPPEPDCGFACGPGGACPADYTCAADHHCHRDGTPASLNCGPPPADAAPDSPPGPHVLTTYPADGATGVAVDAVIQAVADMPLQGSPQGLVLLDDTTPVSGTVQFIVSSTAVQLTPDAQLAPNHHFTAKISSAITNEANVPLGPYQWSFDTGADTVAPHLQSSAPAANATGVTVTTGIRVVFDEAVTGIDNTSFTATDGVTPVVGTVVVLDPRTYELRPASSLPAGSTITVSLGGAIMDTSGNALAPVGFSFMTAP